MHFTLPANLKCRYARLLSRLGIVDVSLLQITGSSPYVRVHVAGPLAATVRWSDYVFHELYYGQKKPYLPYHQS